MSNMITNPPTLPFSPMVGTPKMDDLFNIFYKQIMLDLRCHAIGTIKTFNSENQTAQISVNYTQSRFVRDEATGQYQQNEIFYPLLSGVPVVCFNGGSFSLTFPVSAGDQCLLLFNDRDIDNWFSQSQQNTVPCATGRLHSFADAIAIVGLHPTTNKISNYDTSHALLSNGSTQVGISATQARVANATTTLGIVLTQLMTALTTFNTALETAATAFQSNAIAEPAAASGGADLALAATALQVSVTAIQLLITSLLE